MSPSSDPTGPAASGGPAVVHVREDGSPSQLARQFALLAAGLVAAGSAGEVFTLLVRAAHRLLPAADAVSITVRAGNGTFRTPVSLGPVAAELDRIQYDIGSGPCVDAARMSGPGLAASADLATTPAWPGFGEAASARGFAAAVSTALAPEPGVDALGALNVYARRGHLLGPPDHDVALLLGTHGALALAHVQALSFGEVQQARLLRASRPR